MRSYFACTNTPLHPSQEGIRTSLRFIHYLISSYREISMRNTKIRRLSTHPDIAALVTPLSASRIEGLYFFTLFAAKPQRGWSSEA
jgi:hypothetical protein